MLVHPKDRRKTSRAPRKALRNPTATGFLELAHEQHSRWRGKGDHPLSGVAQGSYFAATQVGFKAHMRQWTDLIEHNGRLEKTDIKVE